MREHVLSARIKDILDERGYHYTDFEVSATKDNDKEYLISFKKEVYIPHVVFEYLETIGVFGVQFTGKSMDVYFIPDIPEVNYPYNKIGEYFDKLYPTLSYISSWHFEEQEPSDIPIVTYQMSKGVGYWMYMPSDSVLNEHENIRKQLEFITGRLWKLIMVEKEGENGWIRYDFKEVVYPYQYE